MRFIPLPKLGSSEASTSQGVWSWAKRLVETIERDRNDDILTTIRKSDLTGKAGYSVVVNATEDGFELVP